MPRPDSETLVAGALDFAADTMRPWRALDLGTGTGCLLLSFLSERPRAYVRAHSQELSDAVCDRHIALYVNDFTLDLGARGRTAIVELLARGRAAGLLPEGPSPFRELP